jgi:hypothetical protein
MSPKWFIGFTTAFILLTLLFSVGEMIWIGAEGTPLLVAMNPLKYGAAAWMGALGKIITFKYTFFSGPWILARWILFTVVSGGFMIGLVINLGQGIVSALSGLFRVLGGR